jgi:putative transposase
VLLPLLYRLMWCVLGLLGVLVRSDLSKDVELLVGRQENQMLRRQLSGHPRWDYADRLWLRALSRLVNRRRWPEVCPVTPGHDPALAPSPGRPQVDLYRPAPAAPGHRDAAGP